jgi:hypothetical protein
MRTPFSTIVAFILITALGGCAANNSGSREPSKPDIGAAPPYAAEVHVPPARGGDSPVVQEQRERAGRLKANAIIRCLLADQAASRATFLGVPAAGAEPSNCARPRDAAKGRKAKRVR